jgi:hypothetical protein
LREGNVVFYCLRYCCLYNLYVVGIGRSYARSEDSTGYIIILALILFRDCKTPKEAGLVELQGRESSYTLFELLRIAPGISYTYVFTFPSNYVLTIQHLLPLRI